MTTLCLVFRSQEAAPAATILFVATDLTDTVTGQDLWRFSYQVGGFNFAANQGFTISFDRNLFTNLESPPPPVNADWDVLTLQPDLALSSNGFYDAQAVISNPSLSDTFTVKFVWLGAGTPGAQPFTIYDTNFSTIEQGLTVPEPGTGILVCCGLFVAACGRTRRAPLTSVQTLRR